MAIDPEFEQNSEKAEDHEGHAVWGPVDEPEELGIHGTHVAVDFDICIADGACLEDCPVDVFEWVDTPDHPESEIKVSTSARSTPSTSIPAAPAASEHSSPLATTRFLPSIVAVSPTDISKFL